MVDLGYLDINANCVYEKGWTQEHAVEFYIQLKKIADYFLNNNLAGDIYCSLFEEDFFKPKEEDDVQPWCGSSGFMLAVDPKGDIYPCIRFMESSLGTDIKPLIIGNANDGLASKQCEKDCLHCLNCVTRRTQNNDECFYCPLAAGCSNCLAYDYQDSGDLNHRATYICEMHKARSLANVYYWNMYYQKNNIDKKFKMHCPKDWALKIISEDEYNMLLDLSE
jgi:radical SAM peptide maturase (CXXX-repeat target family)